MNTLVNFIASYLPPIRVDKELPPPSRLGQRHDRATSRRSTDTDHTQADEVSKLRTPRPHAEEELANANSVRTLESEESEPEPGPEPELSGEELRSLETFLTKTDEYSGQQIVQAVHDLNTEILQLAAAVSDEFPLTRRSPGLCQRQKESHCEVIREAIGDGMLALLRDGDHEDDPTVVQLAIQAWEVWCCRQVLDSFCTGVPPEVDRFLNDVFHEMQSSEPQATTSRWRTLTHIYSRRVVSNYNAGDHIGGILAILALAGCADERGVHNELLLARFGERLSHITERTESLARILREGVSSAWFSVVVERPSVTPLARGKGPSRGQGSIRSMSSQTFDAATMENVYAGYGSEECGVLCTVAFGLSVVKRREEGDAWKDQQSAYLDMKVEQGPTRSKAGVLETTLLIKPKVLLESVEERHLWEND